ncbi:MAG: YfdX family protein [Nitrosomonas sp.]|nr:YfdX family protein [Nitrosomonas sp.]
MSKKALIYGSILALILMQPSIFLAAGKSETDVIKEKTGSLNQEQPQYSQVLANKMMGHIDLARFALAIKLPRHATHQIEKAQIIEAVLASQLSGPRINTAFNYGKIDYAKNARVKEHYVPVVDDVLLISDYEEIFNYLKKLNVQETDAGLVQLKIAINLDDIKVALDNAFQSIEHKEYEKAQQTLAAAFSHAVIEEKEIENPILAISENLALAKAFLNNAQYEKSRFAFKYVQTRLNGAHDAGIDENAVKKFTAELNELQMALRRKDPSMALSIYDHIDEWMKIVRGY